MTERSAHKVRGYILRTIDGDFVFRVYTNAANADRKEFKDYKIRHQDLEVEIVDDYSSFFEFDAADKGDYDGYIDYPSRLGKVTTADSVV